jgi:hypothetical protein
MQGFFLRNTAHVLYIYTGVEYREVLQQQTVLHSLQKFMNVHLRVGSSRVRRSFFRSTTPRRRRRSCLFVRPANPLLIVAPVREEFEEEVAVRGSRYE